MTMRQRRNAITAAILVALSLAPVSAQRTATAKKTQEHWGPDVGHVPTALSPAAADADPGLTAGWGTAPDDGDCTSDADDAR